MAIAIMFVGNVVFGFFVHETWNNIKKIRKNNELNSYPIWGKILILVVALLALFSFALQIISFIEDEYQMAYSMLLLACVCQHTSINLLKPKEEINKDISNK